MGKLRWVGLGGAVGAICRYLIGRIPVHLDFPVLTLLTNMAGAVLIGVVTGLALRGPGLSDAALLFWKTGVCGGFTTFSAFSLESLGLLESGKPFWGGLYILLSVGCCIGGVALGQAIVRLFVKPV